jgi:hypothetical protein
MIQPRYLLARGLIMAETKSLSVPFAVLLLDIIGAILAGLGLAELTAEVGFVSESLRFPNFEIFMIVVGFALMVPMIRHSLAKARAKRSMPD